MDLENWIELTLERNILNGKCPEAVFGSIDHSFRDSPNYNQGQYIKSYQIERSNRTWSKMLFSEIEKKILFSFKIAIFAFFSTFWNFRESMLSLSSKCFDFYFFLFLTSRNSYENKIQEYSAVIKFFSNWIYFLEIDRVLGHVTWTNHVTPFSSLPLRSSW